MAFTANASAHRPLAEINTTPLIDVMLVLLIMMIMTIPVATNVTDVALPGDSRPSVEIRSENKVTITPAGTIGWNGSTIDEAQLATALKASLAIRPEPLLEYEPDGQAPYGVSARVLHTIKQSGVGTFGFVGNERYREFGKSREAH